MANNPFAALNSRQLTKAATLRGRIEKLETELARILNAGIPAPEPAPVARRAKAKTKAVKARSPRRRKRRLSTEGRARLSAAAKLRWAKRKAAGKNRL
jgi:hypothetical protein